MADIFVSYARADKARVAPLVAALKAQGWSVWWDPAIVPGQEFDDLIAEEIDKAAAVVVVWTPASVASRWVRGEAREAAERGVLVPVRFDGARLPIDARSLHTTDLDAWKEDTASAPFQELLSALSLHLKDVPRATPETERRTAICVLPFANMSNDPEQEYFSDGISEDIITDLSKVRALTVISRNSAFTFKGKHVDLPEVARQLKVSHILEGSVRKSGNRVRITAQLIDGATNGHVWAERYDRNLDDIFALQDEISEEIVSALRLKLLPEERKAIEDRGTKNAEAYDLLLQARAAANQMLGRAGLERAIALVRRAIALDPAFGEAHMSLAGLLTTYGFRAPERRAEALKEADAIREQLWARAPYEFSSLVARMDQLLLRRRYFEAEQLLQAARRSVAGAPADGLERLQADLNVSVCRFKDTVETLRRIVCDDPFSAPASLQLQIVLDIVGRSDEAQVEYERIKDSGDRRAPIEFVRLLRMWKHAGRDEITAQWAIITAGFLDDIRLSVDGWLEHALFDPQMARGPLCAAFDDPANQDPRRIFVIGIIALLIDDKDLALAAFRRALVEMHFLFPFVVWHPALAELRADPRFKDLVRDMGLYDYWRASGKWGDFARPKGDDDFEVFR